jgi:hypothetical protein
VFSIKARAKPQPNQRLKLTGGASAFSALPSLRARPAAKWVIQRMNRGTLNHKQKEIESCSASLS